MAAELSKDIIGKKMDPFKVTIERGKIREFCLAIQDNNPLFLDQEYAKSKGYKDTPAPLTFCSSFVFWGYPKLWDDMESLGIDTGRLLHMREDYSYERPMYPGETITCSMEVLDVKTGKMDMVTFKTVMSDSEKKPVLTAKMSIIMRPEDK
jgi:acyl dehydratase